MHFQPDIRNDDSIGTLRVWTMKDEDGARTFDPTRCRWLTGQNSAGEWFAILASAGKFIEVN